jgi:hypothetical protein
MSSDITLVSSIIIQQTAQFGVSRLVVAAPTRHPQGEQSAHEWPFPGSPLAAEEVLSAERKIFRASSSMERPCWAARTLNLFWSCHPIVESLRWPYQMLALLAMAAQALLAMFLPALLLLLMSAYAKER